MSDITAYCTCCGRRLPRTAFRQRHDRPAGVYSWCLECEAAATRRRYYRQRAMAFEARTVRA